MTAAARAGAEAADDDLRTIQQVSTALGLTQRALRFYEDKGLVEPMRVGTMRVYDRRAFARLQLIVRGKRLGFSIREIAEFLDLYDADPDHREQLRRLLSRTRERLAELAEQKDAIEQTIAELDQIARDAADGLVRAEADAAPPRQRDGRA